MCRVTGWALTCHPPVTLLPVQGIVALASACPHLQVLSLRNIQLQDQHLHQLALSTGHLTELGLGMVRRKGLRAGDQGQ